MSYLMKVNDFLVLRDGHPFGENGQVESYARSWPLPQTLVGMIRTHVGFSVSKDYFKSIQNQKDIFNVGIEKVLPVLVGEESSQFVLPIPEDIIFSQNRSNQQVYPNQFKFTAQGTQQWGTDIQNPDWLIPELDLNGKPSKVKPFFMYWELFEAYLKEELPKVEAEYTHFGCSAPISDSRLHNSIDSTSYTTAEGRLFSNKGIHFKVKTSENETSEIQLLLSVIGDNTDLSGTAHLGGERKTVQLENTALPYLPCPGIYSQKQYLKLILTTHGDFGSWCPSWLMPNLLAETIDWVSIPNTKFEIRLRSAFIGGYEHASGWDYVARGPKASKKLTTPGAVYLIELKNPDDAHQIAEYFWGSSMDPLNTESNMSGYNQVVVGNAEKMFTKKNN